MSSLEPRPPERIRLTIAHLMLWMLCSSIVLASYRALEAFSPAGPPGVAQRLYLLFNGLVLGISLATVPLFISRWLTDRGGFPTHPGHWMLLIRGFTTIVWLIGWLGRVAIEQAFLSGPPNAMGMPSLFLLIQYLPGTLTGGAGYSIAMYWNAHEGRLWQLSFALVAVNSAITVVLAAASFFLFTFGNLVFAAISWNSCVAPLIAILVLFAAALDRRKTARDYLHWTGVVIFVVMSFMPLVYGTLRTIVAAYS